MRVGSAKRFSRSRKQITRSRSDASGLEILRTR